MTDYMQAQWNAHVDAEMQRQYEESLPAPEIDESRAPTLAERMDAIRNAPDTYELRKAVRAAEQQYGPLHEIRDEEYLRLRAIDGKSFFNEDD